MALFSAELWQLHRLETSVGIDFSPGKNGEHSASVSLSGASPQPAKERLASPRKAFSKKQQIRKIFFPLGARRPNRLKKGWPFLGRRSVKNERFCKYFSSRTARPPSDNNILGASAKTFRKKIKKGRFPLLEERPFEINSVYYQLVGVFLGPILSMVCGKRWPAAHPGNRPRTASSSLSRGGTGRGCMPHVPHFFPCVQAVPQ